MQIRIASSISELNAQEWDALSDGSPILSHAFLSCLEHTGCVGQGTGWQAAPLLAYQGKELVGAVPLYLKSHSYGEYVFDWSWADAYERSGLQYYPKLLSAIPFTPITGPRLLAKNSQIQTALAQALIQHMMQYQLSSSHILFPDESTAAILRQTGWLERHGVQFRWHNADYASFSQFLAQLSHDKRKKIQQERKKVMQADIVCKRQLGHQATYQDWDFFYACYQSTYYQHHSTPYLTREFFHALAQAMPDNILLIIAEKAGQPVAAAFNLFNQHSLYGRYWGALEFVSGLHFELCYYQAQEFCIERGISYFEGGAQGEHKLARGFMPRPTCSFHMLAHPDFEAAIRQFLQREATGISHYQDELEQRAPFKPA